MRSAAAVQRRIDFEKKIAKINMEHNDKQNLRAMSRASQPPRVIRNTIQRQRRCKKTRKAIFDANTNTGAPTDVPTNQDGGKQINPSNS